MAKVLFQTFIFLTSCLTETCFTSEDNTPIDSPRFGEIDSILVDLPASPLTHSEQKRDKLQQKLQEHGIPVHIKTGRVINPEPIDPFKLVLEELKLRYKELFKLYTEKKTELPHLNYFESILTPEITEALPIPIILNQGFDPRDTPFLTALKLERLGLIIKDLPPEDLPDAIYAKKKHLMGKCFALAGAKIRQTIIHMDHEDQSVENSKILIDLYKSGAILYRWALLNIDSASKPFILRLLKQFETSLINLTASKEDL